MVSRKALYLILLSSFCLAAQEFAPWYPPLLQLHTDFKATLRYEDQLAAAARCYQRHYQLQSTASMTVWPQWHVMTQAALIYTDPLKFINYAYQEPKIKGSVEYFKAVLRHLILDESVDPVSCSCGVSIVVPYSRCIQSMTFLYHGHTNLQAHISCGKQWYLPVSTIQGYAVAAVGTSFKEHGWMMGMMVMAVECLNYRCEASMKLCYGLGQDPLQMQQPFQGYGHIAYEQLDVAIKCSKESIVGHQIYVEGVYTLYGKNCPNKGYTVAVGYHLPIGW